MKIRFICVGKLKSIPLRALAEDYAGRLKRFATLEIIEVRDGQSVEAQARLLEESQSIRKALSDKALKNFPNAILWDELGETVDTKKFSGIFERMATVDFVMGSSHGIDGELKQAIPKHLRLSSMTLTHEWARSFALEQVYRAFCVLRGFPYHH